MPPVGLCTAWPAYQTVGSTTRSPRVANSEYLVGYAGLTSTWLGLGLELGLGLGLGYADLHLVRVRVRVSSRGGPTSNWLGLGLGLGLGRP